MYPQSPSLGTLALAEGLRLAIRRVYLWMALGLFLTAAVAFVVASSPLAFLVAQPVVFFGAMIGELALVIILSARVHKMAPATGALMFFFYAALNGLTLSLVFIVYTRSSVAFSFFSTACMFGAMSIVGYTTNVDLTRYGSLLLMGLFGLIIASVVNLFLHSSGLYWIISFAGILLFVGLTAYDTQWIKATTARAVQAGDTQLEARVGVIGALRLYLDFVNLFLMILRVAGRRR